MYNAGTTDLPAYITSFSVNDLFGCFFSLRNNVENR